MGLGGPNLGLKSTGTLQLHQVRIGPNDLAKLGRCSFSKRLMWSSTLAVRRSTTFREFYGTVARQAHFGLVLLTSPVPATPELQKPNSLPEAFLVPGAPSLCSSCMPSTFHRSPS